MSKDAESFSARETAKEGCRKGRYILAPQTESKNKIKLN